MKNKRKKDWEKFGVYLACVVFFFMSWQSQMNIMDKLSDIKERIGKVEIRVEHLEKK